ncbi:MAG: hypothetical protein FWD38_02770 [Oscillospiraceae bacterium]|nr:hypothetical protein [Oscillospiraceae bacterium]
MDFREYLFNKYGYNEPINVGDIKYKNYSRPWIFLKLKDMVDSGEIKRFDTGIYYIPEKLPWGDSVLNSKKVIEQRFISNGGEVYGYIAGLSLLNKAGLSTQIPNMVEIVTNNESTRVRDIKVGNQCVRARRARTEVSKENAETLQFLDLMNIITPSTIDETERLMLSKYIKNTDVTKDSILLYAGIFPAKAMRNMVESGAIYELT